MSDRPHRPRTGPPADPDPADQRPSSSGSARWIGVLLVIVATAALVLVVALHLTGVVGPRAH